MYLDWARGIAVLLMIEAHTSDAWTKAAVRKTAAFRDATILGGFAAPLFLWLAGLAIVLSATRTFERTGSRRLAVEMACRRGAEIFILAFLFRLQGFILTPGGSPVTLFRVDVLNIMGPSMVVAGLIWGLTQTTPSRVTVYAAVASAIAMLTPIVRASPFVDALPIWFQWNLRPAGEHTVFTLFPWSGFVFAGGAAGALMAAAREERAERRALAVLGFAGAAIVALGFYTAAQPSIYRVSSFWTSSPAWFAIRAGILMIALSTVFAVDGISHASTKTRNSSRLFRILVLSWQEPLAALGRRSLFVYWIHVELVYGYATWPLRQRLPLWGTAVAFGVFCVLMYGAVVLRDRLAGIWRTRPMGPTAQTATA